MVNDENGNADLCRMSPEARFALRSAFQHQIKYDYGDADVVFPEDITLPTPHDFHYPNQFIDGSKHAVVLMAALVVGPDEG